MSLVKESINIAREFDFDLAAKQFELGPEDLGEVIPSVETDYDNRFIRRQHAEFLGSLIFREDGTKDDCGWE